ncbi:peptidase M3 [Corallococcus carmarthensis]|uniref:Peptidase M3 n=1 Tax=Corallococcus carmarthensis TaxID=2316728 RepID=A0A3A8JK59_9BACT|nr:peptidase M3 [Corallococcus carmarthensis]RKG96147.1 peptidase M3 [Corallococcus carmarthensis]
MDRPLHSVRSRLDDFLAELATLQYRYGAGLSPDLPVARLYASFPELSSPETFAAANEALARAKGKDDPVAVRRITLVRELIATQVEESLALPAADAVVALEARSHIPADDTTLSLAQALSQLPREPHRARRALLERGAGNFLWENRGAYGDRRDAALQAAEVLGFPDYPALRQDVTGIDTTKLAQAAEETLRRTEDAYRDVLAYVLRKLEPTLRPLPGGEARRHDVQHALRAPWMDAHFRREDTVPAVMRWLSDWGLHPEAGGRIRLDDEARPGKASRPFVAAVRVPHEIRLVLQPRSGMDALGDLLHELGHAWHLAHVDADAPMELRRLGDASVTEAYAATFERLLLSPPWLKRYLGLASGTTKDVVRMGAFQALAVLRRHCAKLSYELSLSTKGASTDRADEYADGQRRALFAQPHPGFFLHDVDSQLYVTRYLRAWALETRLTASLLERFNEDFWRNPAAFTWLKGLFARGGAADAEGLATDVSGTPLALPEAGARLVAILNQ